MSLLLFFASRRLGGEFPRDRAFLHRSPSSSASRLSSTTTFASTHSPTSVTREFPAFSTSLGYDHGIFSYHYHPASDVGDVWRPWEMRRDSRISCRIHSAARSSGAVRFYSSHFASGQGQSAEIGLMARGSSPLYPALDARQLGRMAVRISICDDGSARAVRHHARKRAKKLTAARMARVSLFHLPRTSTRRGCFMWTEYMKCEVVGVWTVVTVLAFGPSVTC
jgi:hypothetical protein